jgi:hypothetical protein
MISFNSLANLGRLGNQMFQLASLIGIARNRGFEFCIAPQRYAGSTDINVKQSDGNVYSIFVLSNLRQEITTYPTRVESTFNFDKSLFDTCSDNIDLIGYFQNEKYFENVESEIRELFSFSDQTMNLCKQYLCSYHIICNSSYSWWGSYLANSKMTVAPKLWFGETLDKDSSNIYRKDWKVI